MCTVSVFCLFDVSVENVQGNVHRFDVIFTIQNGHLGVNGKSGSCCMNFQSIKIIMDDITIRICFTKNKYKVSYSRCPLIALLSKFPKNNNKAP